MQFCHSEYPDSHLAARMSAENGPDGVDGSGGAEGVEGVNGVDGFEAHAAFRGAGTEPGMLVWRIEVTRNTLKKQISVLSFSQR